MGAATVSNGTFIFGADFIWVGLSGGGTFKNPESALFGTQANITLREAVATASAASASRSASRTSSSMRSEACAGMASRLRST